MFSPFFRFLSLPPSAKRILKSSKGNWGAMLASLNKGRTTFAATRHVHWALNAPKCICARSPAPPPSAANAFMVYLEPKERV